MIQLTDDEVALLKSLLVALRSIKIHDIDKALVILARQTGPASLERILGKRLVGLGRWRQRHGQLQAHQVILTCFS